MARCSCVSSCCWVLIGRDILEAYGLAVFSTVPVLCLAFVSTMLNISVLLVDIITGFLHTNCINGLHYTYMGYINRCQRTTGAIKTTSDRECPTPSMITSLVLLI